MSCLADNDESLQAVASDERGIRKEDRFRHMQRIATCLLGAMVVLLFVCVVFQADYHWLAWPRAFAEAGTIGAIADWYAVVALFRHPLGLPIPHTAIIEQNQHRIAESLGSFVEDNFLTPEVIIGRLSGHDTAKAMAEWLVKPANSRAIADVVADSLPGLLDGIDDEDFAGFLDRLVIPQLRTLDLSRVAGNILKVVTDGNRHQPLLDHGLEALELWLTTNAGMLKAKFSAASRYTPAQLDAYIVSKFVEGVIALLHEVVANQDHELRRQFDEALQDLILQLQTSRTHRRFGKTLMRDCLRHFRNGRHASALLNHIRTRVVAEVHRKQSIVRSIAADVLVSLGESLGRSPAVQQKLNAWWLNRAHQLVVRYRRQISELITGVVKGWNAKEASRKIEAEIGRDLQYIRINGTFVGGIVGVLLHAVTLLLSG
ncbi:uncharacterized membrane-anchored protein YjiN (DUF445 family) [Paraburkholderia sp. GAS348]